MNAAKVEVAGYRIERVYRCGGSAIGAEVAALWLGQGVLEPFEAHRRAAEVYLTVRDGGGRLVGVDTVYLDRWEGEPWWFLRMFIHPDHRGRPQLPLALLRRTVAGLAAEPVAGLEPRGVAMVIENTRITHAIGERFFGSEGWRRQVAPTGADIWLLKFSRGHRH